MGLVGYTSTDEEGEEEGKEEGKEGAVERKAMPVLPLDFGNGAGKRGGKRKRAVDDPGAHEGRVRALPYTDGVFVSHIYIDLCLPQAQRADVQAMVDALGRMPTPAPWRALLRPRPSSDVPSGHPPLPNRRIDEVSEEREEEADDDGLHISLSRPFELRRHQRAPFSAQLRHLLSSHRSFTFQLATFPPQALANDRASRAFVALDVSSAQPHLQRLVHAIDRLMEEYRQPAYYAPARFHASFAWRLIGEREDPGLFRKEVARLRVDGPTAGCQMVVSHVMLKIAKDIQALPLSL